MDLIRSQMITTRDLKGMDAHDAVVHNNKLLLDNREGDFMIKINDGYWDQLKSNLYIGVGYMRGSVELGTRRHAAWFKKEEIKEVFEKLGPRWKVSCVTKADRAQKV